MKNNFYFSDSENSFIGNIFILNKNIELEIKQNKSEINWDEAERFLESLNDKYILHVLDSSVKLLMEFIKIVPFGVNEPYNMYDFRLEAIIYYGKVTNNVFSDIVDRFEFVFKLYHSNYGECVDPYGNYIVRIDNRLITGIRREQV